MEVPVPALEPRDRPAVPWRALSVAAGVFGGEGLAGAMHPALGEALAALDAIVPVALITAILFGSDRIVERVFRFLRWAANRPEPPAPRTARQHGSQTPRNSRDDGRGDRVRRDEEGADAPPSPRGPIRGRRHRTGTLRHPTSQA